MTFTMIYGVTVVVSSIGAIMALIIERDKSGTNVRIAGTFVIEGK